jgi:hypothetical protein
MKIKAIVVNPFKCIIYNTEIELGNDHGASAIREIIGDHFSSATRLYNGDIIYVGRRSNYESGFLVKDYECFAERHICLGIGVITGSDMQGNTLSTNSNPAEIGSIVEFIKIDRSRRS